jgi:hypothetical protein
MNNTASNWVSYYENQESSKDLNKQMGKSGDLCFQKYRSGLFEKYEG